MIYKKKKVKKGIAFSPSLQKRVRKAVYILKDQFVAKVN